MAEPMCILMSLNVCCYIAFQKGLCQFIMVQTSIAQVDLFLLDFTIYCVLRFEPSLISWDKSCFIKVNYSLNA